MVRALDGTGQHTKHVAAVVLVIMPELMMTRNVEPNVGSPLRDGEETSNYIIMVCFSNSKIVIRSLFSGIISLAHG